MEQLSEALARIADLGGPVVLLLGALVGAGSGGGAV